MDNVKRKMYHINPNDYGQGYFVMSLSKERALLALQDYFDDIYFKAKKGYDKKDAKADVDYWAKASITKMPEKYSIDEYKEGIIVDHENS